MDIKVLIAQHLEVPKELILEFKEYEDLGHINVLLRNHQKFQVTPDQLEQAARDLEQAKETAVPQLIDITGLGRTSVDRLEEAGITTLEQLLAAEAEEIAATVKQNVETVRGWYKQAEALLGKQE